MVCAVTLCKSYIVLSFLCCIAYSVRNQSSVEVVLRSADLVTLTANPIDEALATIHDPFKNGDDKQRTLLDGRTNANNRRG